MGAIAAAAAGAAAASAAANAASSAASVAASGQGLNSLNFGHLRQLSIPYAVGNTKEFPTEVNLEVADQAQQSRDSELFGVLVEEYTAEESVGIFTRTTKQVKKQRVVYKPISEAIRALLPSDATVVNVVIDWHHVRVRVFYTLP